MFWFVFTHFVAFLVDLVLGMRPGNRDKDLQILVLRHQVRLLQRQRPRPPRITRAEKLTLAVLTAALAPLAGALGTGSSAVCSCSSRTRSSRGIAR